MRITFEKILDGCKYLCIYRCVCVCECVCGGGGCYGSNTKIIPCNLCENSYAVWNFDFFEKSCNGSKS